MHNSRSTFFGLKANMLLKARQMRDQHEDQNVISFLCLCRLLKVQFRLIHKFASEPADGVHFAVGISA